MTVVGGGALDAVEDVAEVLEALGVVGLLEGGDVLALQHTGTYHENSAVHTFVDNLGVGNYINGRAVYDDGIILGLEILHHCLELACAEQF